MPLTLRRTVIAGTCSDDDFSVYDDGLRVGRIMLHESTPQGPQWAWHINAPDLECARSRSHAAVA